MLFIGNRKIFTAKFLKAFKQKDKQGCQSQLSTIIYYLFIRTHGHM